ncbi:ABC transporter permease [Acidisoma cellulosilytica]|uniref:ABC transporter permease n=1 Tax=Acidisoma cellulosilyticum TaxID=2802395 RepID=A0A963Z467_9PROT|nr:ABC transporter permease [Acidisoma cellulosilyticum]MCB8882216.1 ABC transporter permease [Acidisoma cellulosilyticum]
MSSNVLADQAPAFTERSVDLEDRDIRRARRQSQVIRLGSIAALIAVFAYFSAVAPGFANLGNIANVIEQSAVLALLAFGMSIVVLGGGGDVIRGGIDLSLGANLGLCVAVFAVASNAGFSDWLAVAITFGTGAAVGLLNAIAVVGLGVLPLLATLAVMNICAGAELVLTQNTVISTNSPLLGSIVGLSWLGLSVTDWVLVAATVVLIVLVQGTRWGLRLQAVGGQRQAARAAGLRVQAYLAGTYVAAGLLAALAAILQAARLSGSSPGSGDILLSVVLTSLMSTVFSRRLLPTIGGTLLSVLFIGSLINGFQLLNVSSYWVNGVQGVLILFVVAVRSLSTRRGGA